MKSTTFHTLVMTAAVAALLGCPGVEYTVVLHNIGGQEIYDAHVSYGNFRSIGGVIPPSISKRNLFVNEPMPEKAIVEWRLEDGTRFRREVALQEVVPRGFSGEVWFEINRDEVRVVAKAPWQLPSPSRSDGPP